MNIMIVTNSGYLKYAYIMLESLFKYHEEEAMLIYLPYEDLTEEELGKLSDYVHGYSGKQLVPLRVGSEFKNRVASHSGINIDTYYRILGLKLLPENVDRILYLDVDMVIKGNLTRLYETSIEGKAFAVCEDIFGILNGFHQENISRLGIPEGYSYFNAGVMLFNVDYLREVNGAERMIEAIYNNYERYLYNDQDVMNELFYNQLCYVGWDEYNCPPAWYFLDKQKLTAGSVAFADYNEIKQAQDGTGFIEKYQDVTRQIYESAKVIHYLGDTKPWSKTRGQAVVYDIFDQAYAMYDKN